MNAGPILGRIASQAGLILLAAVTAKEATSLLLVAPIAICGLVAAARNDNEQIDAIDVFWLLSTLFFVVRPAQALFQGATTLYAGRAPIHYDFEIILAAFASLYAFSFIMLALLPRSGRAVRAIDVAPGSGVLLLGAAGGFAIALMLSGDIGNVLAPRYDKQLDQISPLAALGQGLLIAASAMLTASFVANRRRTAMDWFSLLACLGLLGLAFNPANTSRFGLIGAWLPIMLIAVPALRKPAVFAATMLFSVLVVMPILSFTTRFGLNFARAGGSSERSSIAELPYIDTFDTLLQGVSHAHQFGFQFGAKVLSIVLCFVPRGVWPEKPVVSGLEIGRQLYARGLVGTPNLSMPIVGDFYMDFGIVGVVIGALVVAVGVSALLRVQPMVAGHPVYGYLIIAALPIIVRGAVGAVILLAACTLLACLALTATSRHRLPQSVTA